MSQAIPTSYLYQLFDHSAALGRREHSPLGPASLPWAWVGPGSAIPVTHQPVRWATAPRPVVRALPQPPTVATPAAAPPAGERREVRIVPELLRAMTLAAATTGRDESEIWAEAAREWLARQSLDDDPPPPPGASRPALPRVTRDRCWGAIDVLLGDLRLPRPIYSTPHDAHRLDSAA